MKSGSQAWIEDFPSFPLFLTSALPAFTNAKPASDRRAKQECAPGRQPLNQKGTPGVDVPSDHAIASATPYAGITQVRFKGYTLSLYGTPRIGYSLVHSTYPSRRVESRK